MAMEKAAGYAELAKEKIIPLSDNPLYPALTAAADFII